MGPISKIIFFCCCATAVVCTLIAFISIFKNRKTMRAEVERQEEARCNVEFSNQKIRATVLDQTCAVKTMGIKMPKTITVFTVVFQTEQEEILTFQIPEEMYEGLEIGQSGLLTVVDGELYGFAPDETEK